MNVWLTIYNQANVWLNSNFVKQAFIMSKTLNDTGHKSFNSYIRGLLTKLIDQKPIYYTHPILILVMVLSNYGINTSPYGGKY